jgi:hypothetical protein
MKYRLGIQRGQSVVGSNVVYNAILFEVEPNIMRFIVLIRSHRLTMHSRCSWTN